MAQRQRAQSVSAPGGPHSISLKVLRLSRPSLATQTPLPPTSFGNGLDINPQASLAYPSANVDSTFPLTPLLTLPAAFGAAYVGETFACTLCANNELQSDDNRSISGVRIVAELQTPSKDEPIPLELASAEAEADADESDMEPGTTLQRTVRHDLKDEGQHVLAVTVSYTETLSNGEGGASGGRARTFRKLYQFVAQQLIIVRSKITPMKQRSKDENRKWILEAQLENVGETSVAVERVLANEDEGVGAKAVDGGETVVLKPQDVEQVMFVLEEDGNGKSGGRTLVQLSIDWRSAMGEKGSVTTGWLASRS